MHIQLKGGVDRIAWHTWVAWVAWVARGRMAAWPHGRMAAWPQGQGQGHCACDAANHKPFPAGAHQVTT